ncbi:MAG: PilN domain-containing protein [Proteobacteria bacterium]|nr:PilN domain-containing protein [Pseudomonadota bacterium]
MIKINLLPFRAARKKENIRREVSIGLLMVVFFIVIMVYLNFSLSKQLTTLKAEEEGARKELARYAEDNRVATQIKGKIKEIKDKLHVIRELEKEKEGPLQLLEDVALSVPEDRLWLQSLAENEGILTIKGTAMDNDTVALFMTNLEKAKSIKSVDLKGTKLQDFPEFKVKASSFVIICKTAFHKEPPKPEQKKGKS